MADGQEAAEGEATSKAVAREMAASEPLPASCESRSHTVYRTLLPEADVTAREDHPDTNFDSATTLLVDGGPAFYESFLRFDLPDQGGTVTKAMLRLYVKNGTTTGMTVHKMFGGFEEATVTWNDRPFVDAPVATVGAFAEGTWVNVDVRDGVKRGSFSLGLNPVGFDGADFSSREASNVSRRPRLDIEVRYDGCTDPAPAGAGVD
ncbi:MAG: DNRLRE domain-containing protein [Myxococcaceae bacterium]|nr:MAG: DNRLRE domain-containing protein [Myxococcaceae bacterium]